MFSPFPSSSPWGKIHEVDRLAYFRDCLSEEGTFTRSHGHHPHRMVPFKTKQAQGLLRWMEKLMYWTGLGQNVNNILGFLTELFSQEMSYSTLNVTQSAVSLLEHLGQDCVTGSSALSKLCFQGAVRTRLTVPRYSGTSDVGLVLDYLCKFRPADFLDPRSLILNMVILMALMSAQCCQTFHPTEVQNIKLTWSSVTLTVPARPRNSGTGFHQPVLHFSLYEAEPALWVAACTRAHLEKTSSLSSAESEQLFYLLHDTLQHSLLGHYQEMGQDSDDSCWGGYRDLRPMACVQP